MIRSYRIWAFLLNEVFKYGMMILNEMTNYKLIVKEFKEITKWLITKSFVGTKWRYKLKITKC